MRTWTHCRQCGYAIPDQPYLLMIGFCSLDCEDIFEKIREIELRAAINGMTKAKNQGRAA